MPRELRLEYSGALYHMMNRGEIIFRDEADHRTFVELVGRC